jgi:hypothetical protein
LVKIQLVNTYLKIMDEGLVPYIKCGSDEQHYRPFVRFYNPEDESDDSLELWCLSCNWTRHLGLRDYEHMKNLLTLHGYFDD